MALLGFMREPESDPTIHQDEAMISVFCAQIASSHAKGTANPRSELDSHANMMVVGKNAFIFESTGRTCEAKPFSEDLGVVKNIPIVDAAIAYDCPYTHQCYISFSFEMLCIYQALSITCLYPSS